MISAYQTALNGLKAFGTKLQSNSNNIANANTDGFKKSPVQNSAVAPRGVKSQTQKISAPGPEMFQQTDAGMESVELSNMDLAGELVNMKLNSTMYEANLKTIQSVDEMTAILLAVKA